MEEVKMIKPIYAFDPKKNRKIKAGIYKEGTFTKEVKSRHFMRKENGYGIQEEVIERLQELGCQTVVIASPTNKYTSEFNKWLQQPVKDYGHGKQRFLTVA